MELLDTVYWNNTISEWLKALAVTIMVLVLVRLVKWGLMRYFSKRDRPGTPDLYELVATMARRVKLPIIMVLSVSAGMRVLHLPKSMVPWVHSLTMAAVIIQLALWAVSLVDHYLTRSRQRGVEENAARETTLRAAGVIIKLVLAAIAAVLILDNIPGVQITALVASLGIGGIAVALAVQNILSDLFASLSIVLDKPFVIGDFALNFEVVYYVLDADYNRYMDIQEAINLAIFRSFQEEGIDFAYPTRTLHIAAKSGELAIR